MTNGEKLKEIFPNIIKYGNILIDDTGVLQKNILFDDTWWNSEYEESITKNDCAEQNGCISCSLDDGDDCCRKLYEESMKESTTKNCESCKYYGSHYEVCNYCYKCSLWTEKESTTKNDSEVDYTINGFDDFIKFGKKAFGVELTIKKSDNPDTYEKLFGTTKNDLGVDAVSRQEVLYLIADNDLSMGQVFRGIHALPPVTSMRPKGHWISLGDNNYECSECHEKCYFPKLRIANYCFFCGAKMVESQESEGKE